MSAIVTAEGLRRSGLDARSLLLLMGYSAMDSLSAFDELVSLDRELQPHHNALLSGTEALAEGLSAFLNGRDHTGSATLNQVVLGDAERHLNAIAEASKAAAMAAARGGEYCCGTHAKWAAQVVAGGWNVLRYVMSNDGREFLVANEVLQNLDRALSYSKQFSFESWLVDVLNRLGIEPDMMTLAWSGDVPQDSSADKYMPQKTMSVTCKRCNGRRWVDVPPPSAATNWKVRQGNPSMERCHVCMGSGTQQVLMWMPGQLKDTLDLLEELERSTKPWVHVDMLRNAFQACGPCSERKELFPESLLDRLDDIESRLPQRCMKCRGRGSNDLASSICTLCKGSGCTCHDVPN